VGLQQNVKLFLREPLACTAQCSLKPELRTRARLDAKIDHFVKLVVTKGT